MRIQLRDDSQFRVALPARVDDPATNKLLGADQATTCCTHPVAARIQMSEAGLYHLDPAREGGP